MGVTQDTYGKNERQSEPKRPHAYNNQPPRKDSIEKQAECLAEREERRQLAEDNEYLHEKQMALRRRQGGQ